MIQKFVTTEIKDETIYHFIKIEHFQRLVKGELALVRPTSWEDPYEFLAAGSMITDKRTSPWKQDKLQNVIGNVFSQCWSRNGDSDTLLRAYSSVRKDTNGRNVDSRYEAVKISTTPRALLTVLARALESRSEEAEICVFVCDVTYVEGDAVKSAVAKSVKQRGSTTIERAKATADLCLLKRFSFEHEHEVRALVMFSANGPSEGLLTLKIDPTELVSQISFDPRLAKAERDERAQMLSATGLETRIVDREEYQRVSLDIVVE